MPGLRQSCTRCGHSYSFHKGDGRCRGIGCKGGDNGPCEAFQDDDDQLVLAGT